MRKSNRTIADSPYEFPTFPAASGGRCTAIIGSMTQAMKAQSLLADAAIRATVIKVSSGTSHNGCAYGVDLPCTQSGHARTALERGGIRIRQLVQG